MNNSLTEIDKYGHQWKDQGNYHECVFCGCTDQGYRAESGCPVNSKNFKKNDDLSHLKALDQTPKINKSLIK